MLYLECYPDEVLVRTLGVPSRELRHVGGKGNVLNRLREHQEGLGLVEEDPQSHQPLELGNYQQIQQKGDLVLLRRGTSNRWLIIICPRLEELLSNRAQASGIAPKDYGLPPSAAQLKKIPHYERRRNFPEFLQDLCQTDEQINQLQE